MLDKEFRVVHHRRHEQPESNQARAIEA
jgi:hypothetical protein